MSQKPAKFDLSGDASDLIVRFDRMRQAALAARRSRDWQASLNLAFYGGQQWLVWDNQESRFRRVRINTKDPNHPVLITINKVSGIVDRSIAKLTKGSPIPECRPVSDDESDIRAARAGTRVLASEFDRFDFETMLPELYGWVVPAGWGYLSPTWDKNAGPLVGKDDEGQVHRGEVDVEIVPHYEITHDLNAKGIKDARWVIRTTVLTDEEVYERYGKEVTATVGVRTLGDDMSMLSDFSSTPPSEETARVAVHQIWIPKGKMRSRPNGLVMTWAGTEILEPPKDFPYDHNTVPFVQFNDLPPKGTPWGRTPVDDLIPMQMDYNDSRSREMAIRRVLIPHVIAPRKSIDPSKMGSRVALIDYLPLGAEPKIMMPDARWLTQWETAMDRADSEMGERTGINDASKGDLTGTSPAATVLAQQEAAAEPLGLPAKELAKGVKELGWQVLMLCRQFWDEARIVRTWSQSGFLEVDAFKGADIDEELDVRVSTESALPRSKAGRTQLILELMQLAQTPGADGRPLLPGFDGRTLIRALDLPQTDVLSDLYDRDEREAEYVLGELVKGEKMAVQPWQAFDVHLRVINDFRKTDQYRSLDDTKKGHIEGYASALEGAMMMKAAGMQPPGPNVENGGLPPGQVPMAAVPAMQMATPATPGLPDQTPVPTTTQLAGITGGVAGQPGPVPGVSPDQQAASMGS